MKKATAGNDVQVIQKALEEYIGKRKVAKVAVEISAVMQEETQHTHRGEVFYTHKDEDGTLVLTKNSIVKSKIEAILKSYLKKDEVEECLELLIGWQPLSETKTTVETAEFETIKIEGSDSCIYAELMKHEPANIKEIKFKDNLKEAISSSVQEFEVFVCDPSIDENGKLQFVPGFDPAVGYSHRELENLAKKNGLRLGSKFEYVLFLGTLINKLIIEGWSDKDAWHAVCVDSYELGHYFNCTDAKDEFEPTGSRKKVGKCDLANTHKILALDKEARGFWEAGGDKYYDSDHFPLATLELSSLYDEHDDDGVGWFVR